MTGLLPVLDLTPVGLLGLVVVMVLLGYLIPLRTHRLHLSDKDATIAAQRETIEALKANNAKLLRGNDAAVHVLDALPDVVGGGSDGGATDEMA